MSRSWRWLAPQAVEAEAEALAEARGWRLSAARPRTRFDARTLEWEGDDGLRVGFVAFHEQGVCAVWADHAEDAARDQAIAALSEALPVWSDEAIRQQAAGDEELRSRLVALRTWAVASAAEAREEPALVEALGALARDEHPLARVAALELTYLVAPGHRESVRALAEQRAEQDEALAESWQHLASVLAESSD